ncbi:MAG TPA: hypothetical protein VJG90_05765 [Candidatus Nanoarchaeia archaeon]|nr:hypothetical protein [Candidatus Nanoarchaeia archaeon]
MNKLGAFCKQLGTVEPDSVLEVGRRYYQVNPELIALKEKITSRDVYSIGLPLGEDKKEFMPSPALLEILAKTSIRKVTITKKGSWLFLCKRDVFEENLMTSTVQEGLVLVQNEYGENLGLGELKKIRGKTMLKVVLDRGDYLRREK